MGMGLAVSQSVSQSDVVVLSLVPVAGSHLSELIMCDKTGRRKKAASLESTHCSAANIIRDEICPPLVSVLLIPPSVPPLHTIVISAGIPDSRYTFDHL